MSLSLFLSILLLACSKKSNSNNDVAPSNLTLSAVVSTDNSGNVNFTAAATNAVKLRNGSVKMSGTIPVGSV